MNLKIGTKEESINHMSAFILPGTELRPLERQLRLNRFAYGYGLHALAKLEFAASLFREGLRALMRMDLNRTALRVYLVI